MRVLITAGPTREPLDPVRFLSNRSTGRMGLAIAEAALRRGHEVQVVLGPIALQPPVGADVYVVETTDEMLAATLDFLDDTDAIICAAAVCDYRPTARSEQKLKRGAMKTIELVENPDIAAEVGARRGTRPLAVFALETTDGVANAIDKLERKNADLCVLNTPDAIGADEAAFTLVRRDGSTTDLGKLAKGALAQRLLDEMSL
ncbi:MAG: phosphopantothenoylcysteine decarboxylase [Planctomycetota bacterium]|nr:phosphopantothenoylcysteine decarboxylase [Planctomycetota bacterium]